MRLRMLRRSESGAMLVQVAVAFLALTACSALAVDFGAFWLSRTQAQTAADAAAMAGAVALSYDSSDKTDSGLAKKSARAISQANLVWGEAPAVNITTDITFPVCPDGTSGCIRVNAYRDAAHGNKLPVLFGTLVGLTGQGIRATATAQARVANATTCLKPWIIPDKWADNHDTTAPIDSTWTAEDTFETGNQQGQTWTPFNPPDVYTPPSSSGPGTGFTVAADLGMMVTMKAGGPQTSISPGVYFPVRIPTYTGGSTGGSDYRANISDCNGVAIPIGTMLESENGNMIGPTAQGVSALIARDPGARWDPVTKSVTNSCAQASPSCGTSSPRIVAVPIFDTALYESTKRQGLPQFKVVNILGFFLDQMQGNDVRGYLTEAPGLSTGTVASIDPQASFLTTIQLIR